MLVQKQGNLLEFIHQAYAHGVSNKGTMGKGIARQFAAIYPQMYKQYKSLCLKQELRPGDCFFYESKDERPSVFNLITQDNLVRASIDYLRQSVRTMHSIAISRGIFDIAMPEIGCGLGKLRLDDLIDSLQPFINDSKHHVTIYSIAT